MAPMGATDRRDVAGVPGSCEPVMHGSPDSATQDRRFARTVMAGNQEDHPVAAGDRLFETAIYRRPGGVESHTMQVEHAVRPHGAAAQAFVPAAVESFFGDGNALRRRDVRWSDDGAASL